MKKASSFFPIICFLSLALLGWAMSSNNAQEAPSGFDNQTIDPAFATRRTC
jgi:hypothetical protein